MAILLLAGCSKTKTNPTPTTPSPAISGISPVSGTAGTTVTISGSNFDATVAGNTVKFNGTLATISTAAANSLVVTAPAGGSSGTVTVTTSAGTATGPGFTYTQAAAADVYVAGFEVNSQSHPVAKVWKNGTAIVLSDGSKDAYAYSVFVSGTRFKKSKNDIPNPA